MADTGPPTPRTDEDAARHHAAAAVALLDQARDTWNDPDAPQSPDSVPMLHARAQAQATLALAFATLAVTGKAGDGK